MDPKESQVLKIATDGAGLDAKSIEKVRDFLHQMGNTVSAMKIFPSDHATIKGFIDDLSQKILAFLDVHGKLELAVEEFSFTCEGKTVYTDQMAIKSLPFFFFKDGMQKIFLYQGIDREEIFDFLNLIKVESKKPPREGDIITALWEKDFAHIQYFAPDEFLENRILQECGVARPRMPEEPKKEGASTVEFTNKAIEIKVDTTKFTKGKLELSAEDRQAVDQRSSLTELSQEEQPRIALEKAADAKSPGPAVRGGSTRERGQENVEVRDRQEPPAEEGAEESADKTSAKEKAEPYLSPVATMDFSMSEPELLNLESLVSSSRKISPDEEFLNLMAEILNLEKPGQDFGATLEILMQYHLEQILLGNFVFSSLLVRKLRELKVLLGPDKPDKGTQLDSFLKRIGSAKTHQVIKELVVTGQTLDWDAMAEFFRLLGHPALSMAADIYESVPDPEAQKKILEFIKSDAMQDLGALASLAADERPLLSKAIIGLLSKDAGRKGLPHFAVFLALKNKDIKLEAIRALGQVQNEMSNRILLGFLNDADEDLRIQAAMRLNPQEERSRIQHILGEAGSKAFRAKSLKEKQAILTFLGRTRTDEALEFLRGIVEKRSLWLTSGTREMKLAAVAGLENHGSAEASQVLEKAATSRHKDIREASSQALARLAQSISGRG